MDICKTDSILKIYISCSGSLISQTNVAESILIITHKNGKILFNGNYFLSFGIMISYQTYPKYRQFFIFCRGGAEKLDKLLSGKSATNRIK